MPTGPMTAIFEGVERSTVQSADGVTIAYERIGDADRCIVLANGLGGRLYTWKPIVDAFRDNYRILTWDYRGLFGSDAPDIRRHMSVHFHAQDLVAMLDKEGIDQACLMGWSMGVQVSLETATLFPERVKSLVLINGTHGHTMETAFQPLFRVPWLPGVLHAIIDRARERPPWLQLIQALLRNQVSNQVIGGFLAWAWKNPTFAIAYRQYFEDIFQEDNFPNYLSLFQELDGHSVIHHLRDIEQPALVVSGALDVLTPAYQSSEMARRLPDVEHLKLPFGTHFVLLEFPEKVVGRINQFLAKNG